MNEQNNEIKRTNGISRRDFLKGVGAGAVGVMATGLLGGCTPAAEPTPTPATPTATPIATPVPEVIKYNPGTYTATAYGNISDITVEVTFSDSAIESIQVVNQGETPVLFQMVEDEMIPAMVEHQAGGVDSITGASNSCRAVKEAVADCVKQAGGDPEAFLAKTVEKTPSPDEEYDTDIVVLGCGASGFVASVTAAKNGAKVMVLEKGSSVAAVNGIKVSGPFAVNTSVQAATEGNVLKDVDEVLHHVLDYTHWTPNPALMRRCLETSAEAVETLRGIGYEFKLANFRFETPFKDEKEGFHLILNSVDERVQLWEKALKDNNINVLYNTTAQSLIMKDGKAVGVKGVKEDGTKITVNAKAVIVATGGYLGNRDLQEKFLKTRKLNVASGGESLCTGDGILMATDVGAAMEKTFGYCPCEYGGTNSKASRPAKQDKYDQNTAFKFGLYGCLLVDAHGKRFINEGLLCDYPMSYGSEQIIRNTPWFSVVDQAYVDAMATQGLYEYTTAKGATSENWFIGNYFKGRILTNIYSDIEEGLKEGWLWKADTLEELAEKLGMESLLDTVKTYNGFCEEGVDKQFGANPWYLSKVAQGPFYVVENEPSAWSTFGGLRIDDCCRVQDIDFKYIEGLYACGTDCGSLYYSPYYDVAGFCYNLCIDSGVIAAKEATAYVQA